MAIPGRKYEPASGYRYGFNGKEQDKDLHSLTAYDYGFRIYNPALGRFLSVDPLTKSYPELTPYQFASNTPIQAIDLDGLEARYHYYYFSEKTPVLAFTISKDNEIEGDVHKLLAANNFYTSKKYYTESTNNKFLEKLYDPYLYDMATSRLFQHPSLTFGGFRQIDKDNEDGTIEGLFRMVSNAKRSCYEMTHPVNQEPWNGTPEERMYFFNQISAGAYFGMASAINSYEMGKMFSPSQPSGVSYDRVKDIHSKYSDGRKVFEGEQPGRISGPDPTANGYPHTVLKWDFLRMRIYKARTFGYSGIPIKDIDFTLPTFPNGTIRVGHFVPEQHLWLPNPSGGTPIRGPGQPFTLKSGFVFMGSSVIKPK